MYEGVNWVAVLAAAVANFVVGFIWFGPLFGKTWKNWMGLTDEGMRSMPLTPMQAMVGGFVTSILMACVLGRVLLMAGSIDIMSALSVAFWLWLGFVATATAGMWLWEGKSFKLFALVAGGHLAAMLVMAIVLVSMM